MNKFIYIILLFEFEVSYTLHFSSFIKYCHVVNSKPIYFFANPNGATDPWTLGAKSKDSLHPTTQSGFDSQTNPYQASNTSSGCNAVRSIGSAVWTAGARPYKPARPFSDDTKRCIRRTIRGCRLYRSSLFGCRFGSIGSSGFVVGFRCLRLSNSGFVLAVACFGEIQSLYPTFGSNMLNTIFL